MRCAKKRKAQPRAPFWWEIPMIGFQRRYPFVWSYLRPFWPSFLWIGAVLVGQIVLNVLAPLPTKFILNDLLKSDPHATHAVLIYGVNLGVMSAERAIYVLTGITLVIAAFLVAGAWAEQLGLSNIVFRSRELLRRDLLARIFTRQQSYLDSKKKVDLLGRFSGDVENTEILVVNGVPSAVRDVPILFVMIAMMFTVNVRLTLLFLALLPFAVYGAYFFTARNRRASKLVRRKTVHFEEETYEFMNAMGIVKSLRGEERVQNRLLARVAELTQLGKMERNASLSLSTTLDSSAAVIKAAFILFGGLAIFRAELGWGDLFQILAYVEIFSRHVNNITKFVSKYPKCMASVDRLEELHRELELFPEISGPRPVDHGEIALAAEPLAFCGVSFRHEGGPFLLESFSHTFARGRVVAVVGQSGIGKSSFSRLLNRLSDPGAGSITLGGADLREYPVRELRRAVRVISQESFLLAGTVRENLQLAAAHELSDAEIERALAAVNAWDFVRALPLGLNTPIGEAGLQLSGGQAKRIHLARAFLDRESSVVLFDEPTTGLDTHSAEAVVRSIRNLKAEKSVVFWITHRMQEVGSADDVLFFSPGAKAVVGSAAELLSTNPEFRALARNPGDKTRSEEGRRASAADEEKFEALSTNANAFAKNWPGL